MREFEILEATAIKEVLELYSKAKDEKKKASYNIFTLSSYNNQRENFHSDILGFLLNPNGLHEQDNRFLFGFLKFLEKISGSPINPEDYREAQVTREKGRLDVWISDPNSRKSIIIENKINDAIDQPDQLDNYFNYSETQKFHVDLAVYLSLDGLKVPPISEGRAGKVIQVAAFANSEDDLVKGWLEPIQPKLTGEDSKSFLIQYIKLLKHLASKAMDNNAIEKYYEFFSTKDRLDSLETIFHLRSRVGEFRGIQFSKKFQSPNPFKKKYKYQNDSYWCFDDHKKFGNQYKVDVWFDNTGGAGLIFWNPGQQNQTGREVLTKKLIEIGMLSEFEDGIFHGNNGYRKLFKLNEAITDIREIDQAVEVFFTSLLERLQ